MIYDVPSLVEAVDQGDLIEGQPVVEVATLDVTVGDSLPRPYETL